MTLQIIRDNLGDCQRCKLHTSRKNIVFGSGNQNAELMIVGQCPGVTEDEQGAPFVGKAGELLNKWLGYLNLNREDYYISNILKCHPSGNRDPEQDEIISCTPFLDQQIEFIKPKVIVALGRFAGNYLSGRSNCSMTLLRVVTSEYRCKNIDMLIPLITTYHPSYILRKEEGFDPEKPENYKVLFDLKKALKFIIK